MTCIADTASINLTLASGQLSADVVVDPGAGLPPNTLTVNPTGVYVIGSDGWIPLPSTLAFQSADGHTFVATSSADLRSFLGPGDRIRLVQSGVPGYYIVTAIAAGTITLYGGTDYTLAAQPISTPYFSKAKSPIGLNLSPLKWSEELRDPTDRNQAAAVQNTWYNLGSISLSLPIGAWDVYYELQTRISTGGNMQTTLSTANNTESDADWTTKSQVQNGGSNADNAVFKRKAIVAAVKTSYFVNVRTADSNTPTISLMGASYSPNIARAVCAYL